MARKCGKWRPYLSRELSALITLYFEPQTWHSRFLGTCLYWHDQFWPPQYIRLGQIALNGGSPLANSQNLLYSKPFCLRSWPLGFEFRYLTPAFPVSILKTGTWLKPCYFQVLDCGGLENTVSAVIGSGQVCYPPLISNNLRYIGSKWYECTGGSRIRSSIQRKSSPEQCKVQSIRSCVHCLR